MRIEGSNRRLSLEGGAVRVDSQRMRHIVFSSTEIHYSGTPLILDDVAFIGCTFVMDNTPNSRSLSRSVLTQNPVTAKIDA